jgi:hypothetical protein
MHRLPCASRSNTFRISAMVVAGIWFCVAMLHGATLASAWAAAPFRPIGTSSSCPSAATTTTAAPAIPSKETFFGHRSSARWAPLLLTRTFGRGGGGHRRLDESSTTAVSLSQTTSETTTTTSITTTISDGVSVENFALLSSRGRAAIQRLIQYDQNSSSGSDNNTISNGQQQPAQTHVYGAWPPPGIDDDGKRRLAEQVRDVYNTARCRVFCNKA